jgi:hypothetical protein
VSNRRKNQAADLVKETMAASRNVPGNWLVSSGNGHLVPARCVYVDGTLDARGLVEWFAEEVMGGVRLSPLDVDHVYQLVVGKPYSPDLVEESIALVLKAGELVDRWKKKQDRRALRAALRAAAELEVPDAEL